MILAATGHRPDKLGGYTPEAAMRLRALALACMYEHRPTWVISGMAQGWDWAVAIAAVEMRIPFTAAIPFWGQESRWPEKTQRNYVRLLGMAKSVHVESTTDLNEWFAYQGRNVWMVDKCDLLLALWDGSKGGTANCVRYAREVDRPICNVWESF